MSEKGKPPDPGGQGLGDEHEPAEAWAVESPDDTRVGERRLMNDPAEDDSREIDPRLRQRAEELVAGGRAKSQVKRPSEQEVMRLVHELQVHQVELEMQNEELRRVQLDLALSAERYSDLYDFAPVGYLTVSPDGKILRANLAAATLFGMERSQLAGKPLSRFVAREHLHKLLAIQRQLSAPELTRSTELVLQPSPDAPFWVRLEIVTREDPAEKSLVWQVAVSSIDAEKRAEQMLKRVNEELEQQVDRRTEQLSLTNRQLVEEIARRRQAEAELREREEHLERRVAERTAELAGLLNVARDISSSLDIDGVLGIILRELQSIVRYHGCGIFLLQHRLLTLVAYNGPLARDGLLQSQVSLDDSPLLQVVVDRRSPLNVPDMYADTPATLNWRRTAATLQRQLLHQSRAWMGVPMISQGEVVGILRLDHEQPGYFTDQHADLVLMLASQAAVAVVNARLYAKAQRVAAIEERERLARELHDSVAQTFYSIALATHSAKAQLDNAPNIAKRRLNHILDLAEAGLTEMKALIFDLQAEGIRRDGLVQALQRHLDAVAARNDLSIRVELGTEPAVPAEAKEAVYGIAREALQNVIRHANATELSLALTNDDDVLCLEVRDNGRGFVPDTVGMRTLGLRSMRERAIAVGGGLEITSAPGQGALVRAQIPAKAG